MLGTLDAFERAAVAARLDVDPELAAAVARWETTLAPLGLAAPEVQPPARLWPAIEKRVALIASIGRPALHVVKESVATPEEEPPGGWRMFALAASLAAVVLGGLLVRDRLTPPPAAPMEPLVAALSADGKAPAFLISVDVAKRELTIRRVAADVPADKSARTLARLRQGRGRQARLAWPRRRRASSSALAKYEPVAFEGATYAISLEPRGGSKTGAPSGPVVFSGKLEALPKPGARR